ncbi:short chain dehydrogenase reductase family oxidoreductase [Diplodia corticola]|uniref:Short chain dehydrogenase reductase family oxidoreductase n=1 Tax=Diplodia corticola TaxID=236234 RepID=A0A1J9RAU0_9PEZI|nr:short chain dehydrogenase reductase family oxidoreductase [Diplodia corticola]OJD38718.1 short chain dehydrogenase reductase family oxidoreductase [Diplodia corticola]
MASPPVDCTTAFNFDTVRGKTAIVTGGAQGIGAAYVRALAKKGAYVVIGDIHSDPAENLMSEFPNQLLFIKCDVRKWSDQVVLFNTARSFSPTNLIHAVVANAGISTNDAIFSTEDNTNDEPSEPSLNTIDVNFNGVLYTTKLALHHFRRQHATAIADGSKEPPDTSLVLQGSIAAYLDTSTFCQYGASKWAVRGLMRTLRRVVGAHGTRVNTICPSFLKTALVPPQLLELLDANDIPLASGDDAAECLLRILSDRNINGRALCVVARSLVERAPRGYYDLDSEEILEGPWMKIFP